MKRKPHRLAAGDLQLVEHLLRPRTASRRDIVFEVLSFLPCLVGTTTGPGRGCRCWSEIFLWMPGRDLARVRIFAADTAPLQEVNERCCFRADEVREKFERFGEIRDVYLPRDYYTGYDTFTSPTIYLAQASRKKVMAVKEPRCS